MNARKASRPWRVLVANRGEIALRLIRGLRALGHQTVAVYSDIDAAAPYVRAAHRAEAIGDPVPGESYLAVEKLLEVGRRAGIDAVHPGYGFLSENAEFAQAVEDEGWTFIGPTATSIRDMGDKTRAAAIATSAGVPIVPSFIPGADETDASRLRDEAEKLGLPVLLKAAAGGGGKGMRVAHSLEEFTELAAAARREAESAFGDGRIFVERFIERARHVEVQVVGDGRGGGLAIGERDCSVQRRHQKLIEECPAPGLEDDLRSRLHETAVALVRKTGYRGAGTVEFILAPSGEFFFLEMNTRLQVEHPVTEMVWGLDLVAMQVAVARGEPLPEPLPPPRGHAIEARIYAENPETGFLPSVGTLTEVIWPSGPGVRVDAGVERGSEVSMFYDPLLAKIIVWGEDRDAAITRLRAALEETFIAGVASTVRFCHDVVGTTEFRAGELQTAFIPEHLPDWKPPGADDDWTLAAVALARTLARTSGASGDPGSPGLPGVFESLPGWRLLP